jgi:hypothetical protein
VSAHDHVPPGDPRYDGFRIREIWALTGVDPSDNQEGLIGVPLEAAIRHSLDPGPALGSDERRAQHLREYGREVAARGLSVTLKKFSIEDVEVIE